ncbi:MAG: fumarate hydratase [Candidatus Methanomethylicia archaeon]|nr:fumarate hydratase [Candidatus Methanomethylicia archaeon]MCX8168834.1 fumarate hydratase [Candidatus Methanomethylicia archaeon]MDW7988566.1 fumarate hydratase [Nitrososphaerota archaeon]
MKSSFESKIEDAIVMLIKAASIHLPKDVKNVLIRARDIEDNPLAKAQLNAIIKNCELAEAESKPVCQDTGLISFYISIGDNFPIKSKLMNIIKTATIRATKEVPLRPNAVDVLTGKNSGDNTGRYIPSIDWEFIPNTDKAEITVFLKGGGSETPCIAKVILPTEGLKYAKKLVLDTVVDAGAKPCPPTLIGVGLGGTIDLAVKIAKKALLRPIGVRSSVEEIAKIEEELINLINSLGIGPHGVGGKTTVLDVHVDCAHRHPASYAVAVVFNCWAVRRSTMTINSEGNVNFITHNFMNEFWR